jgi:negative regulator of sigma E activity
MHLRPQELVDIAEGARAESSAPHLTACSACRRALTDLRATMAIVQPSDVPEPSPLFWDELSARVHAAVACEPAPHAFWREMLSWPRMLVPLSALAAAAVLVLAVSLHPRVGVALPPIPSEPLFDAQQIAADPSLSLVADLTAGIDWDTAHEAGLAARGSADHAVTHLQNDELRELRRLLQEELANAGG